MLFSVLVAEKLGSSSEAFRTLLNAAVSSHVLYFGTFLGVFATLRKSDYQLRHVCLSAWNKLAHIIGRIFMKFDI